MAKLLHLASTQQPVVCKGFTASLFQQSAASSLLGFFFSRCVGRVTNVKTVLPALSAMSALWNNPLHDPKKVCERSVVRVTYIETSLPIACGYEL